MSILKKKNPKITEFEQLVYDKVKEIPNGKISTYKLIAIGIGKPNSCRAVGSALKKNPFAPVVPCHRVLSSSYEIGGFFGSTDVNSENIKKKINMLENEGIEFDGNKVVDNVEYRNKITYVF